MALKRVTQLNEGPLDFIKGAARQVAPAVRQTVAAGRQQSAAADLTKAVTLLVQLVQKQAAAKQQQPRPQYQQAAQQAQPSNTTQQMPTRPQMTFASYLHDTDSDLLNEGAWDFIKGVAKAAPTFAKGVAAHAGKALANKFANDPWLTNTVRAGSAAVRDKASQTADVGKQLQQQINVVRQILQRVQNPQNALKRILGKVAGSGALANQIYAMIFPTAQAPHQPTPSTRTTAQWQQGGGSGGQQSTPRQQPARTFGPGNRRRRPTPTQP